MRPSKKEEILKKSLDIFYRNGFQATGIDQIVKETGISKTTIYSHFENKDRLMSEVLILRDKNFRSWLKMRVEELAESPNDKLLCVFDALEEWFNDSSYSSCMFIKASSEFQDPKHPLFVQSAEHKLTLLAYFKELAEDASMAKPDQVAHYVLLLKEGAIIAAHLKLVEQPGLQAKKMLEQLLASQPVR